MYRYLAIFWSSMVAMAVSAPAYAYIDPVTGSFLLQGLLAGFAAAMVFFRSLREKVLGIFRRKKPQTESDETQDVKADSGEQ